MSLRHTVPHSDVRLLLAAALVFCAVSHASSQEPPSSPETPAPANPAAATDATAPAAAPAESVGPSGAAYMKPLSRLSAILGSVHFLRTLCGDGTAGLWRDKMGELIAAQAPNEADRRVLTASFNGGYRSFESTYRKCTPAARLAVARYQQEGADLSREISARFGN